MTMKVWDEFKFNSRNKSKAHDYGRGAVRKIERALVPTKGYTIKEISQASGLSQRVVREIVKNQELPLIINMEGRGATYAMPKKEKKMIVVLKEHETYGVVAVLPKETDGEKVKFLLPSGRFRIVPKDKFDKATKTPKTAPNFDKWTTTIHAMYGATATFKKALKKEYFGN